jgi:hypothetical protein
VDDFNEPRTITKSIEVEVMEAFIDPSLDPSLNGGGNGHGRGRLPAHDGGDRLAEDLALHPGVVRAG